MTCIINRERLWISTAVLFLFLTPLFGLGWEVGEDVVLGKNIKLYSKILKEERTFTVHLPDGYEKSGNSYPVLFVLDAEWQARFTSCTSSADYLAEFGTVPAVISIGITNTIRNRDMIPVKIDNRPNSGGAHNFLNFIQQELIPYVEANYRTEPFRILFGGSNAGLFTVYALLENPDSFAAYIAGSPMIGHCPDFMKKKAENFNKKDITANKFLYMIYGEDDYSAVTEFVPDFFEFFGQNESDRLFLGKKIIAGEGHVPFTSFYHGLRFVFSDWPLPEERRMQGGLEEMKSHFRRVSGKYGFTATVPLDYLLDLGIGLSEKGKHAEAIEALKYACGIHPYSPDAHYYLGTAYERGNNIEAALTSYKKALEIDPAYHMASDKIKALKKHSQI